MPEDMLRQTLNKMPVGYALHKIIVDCSGSPCDYEYVEANRAFEEATGLVAAEIIGKRVTEVIPNIKSDEFDWINTYSEVALKGLTMDFEQYSSSLNKLFKVNAFSPKVGFFVTIVKDINKENETSRKLARELGNQKELESALTRDAMFTSQANLTQNKIIHGLEYYDEYIERIYYDYDTWFEYAKSNVQQEYRDSYCKSLERQTLLDNFNKGIEPKPFEYRRIGSDSWIRLVIRMFKDVETDDVYVFGYGFDIDNEVRERQALMISEEKISELEESNTKTLQLLEAVKREQALIQSIFDSIPGYLYVYDESGRLIKWNKKHETMTGFTAEELSGMTLEKWFDQEDIIKVNATVNDVFEKGYGEVEASMILKNGDKMMVRSSGAPLILDGHKYFTGIGLDITEQKAVWEEKERLLAQMKAMYNEHKAVILLLEPVTGKIIDANPSASAFYGYSKDELLNMCIDDINMLPKEEIAAKLMEILKNEQEHFTFPHKLKNGEIRNVDVYSSPIHFNDRTILFSIIFDATKREEAYKEIIHISYHDYLTGAYNRRFFEEEFERLNTEANFPIAIVMGDVNGLKLTNDSFGHLEGDKLLQEVVNRIGECVRSGDILARIGGDEFGIILPKTDESEAHDIVRRINENIEKQDENKTSEDSVLSVSFGFTIQKEVGDDLGMLMKEAEGYMYSKKFYDRRSLKGKTINVIMNTLFEKSPREKMHSERVGNISAKIAETIGFDVESTNKIRTAGYLHDIGKIGIAENILNKKGKLEAQEMFIMNSHPEKSWRILQNSQEFSEISNIVLYHHEKWDGSGYPKGLKGEEIPINSRIIAVADAYDAMTNNRSYRKKISSAEAINELKKCSGTHFDPEIVEIFIGQVLANENSFTIGT